MPIAIDVENIGKKYLLGEYSRKSFYEEIENGFKKVTNKLQGNKHSDNIAKEFWALKDVSFKINEGDLVGIVGRNGAGKSTLLKLLSRITRPTKGKIILNGRVGSLLEVGTGFHPELTGRENIFLNGSFLGMRSKEIRNKLDEIVDFSGVEEYLDTPVKRYSSGMYVRLAFSVAAHLDPEILIVDEVLAVGDAEFQRKCIGKMEGISGKGRTVLFVSHNIELIMRLCKTGILLDKGALQYTGDIQTTVLKYSQNNLDLINSSNLESRTDRVCSGRFIFSEIWLEDISRNKVSMGIVGESIVFALKIKPLTSKTNANLFMSICIRDVYGVRLLTLAGQLKNKKIKIEGDTVVRYQVNKLPLSSGQYLCDLFLVTENVNGENEDHVFSAFKFSIEGNDYFKSGQPQGSGIDKFFTDFEILS